MNQSGRRSFAAKYQYKGWGATLVILGSFFAAQIMLGPNRMGEIIIGVLLITWGIYLLRGTQPVPTREERERIAEQEREQARQAAYEQALRALVDAKAAGRAATFIAHRNAYAMASMWYPGNEMAIVQQLLQLAQIDPQTLYSNHVGNIPVDAGWIEVFDDWVVWGEYGYDVDATTRGTVYVDQPSGPESFVAGAQLSVASSSWSFSARIHLDAVYEARRIFDQLAAHIETRKRYGISHADIQAMIEVIRNSTNQTESEKIRDLSKLRYEWLLSDEEFEQARQQILGKI